MTFAHSVLFTWITIFMTPDTAGYLYSQGQSFPKLSLNSVPFTSVCISLLKSIQKTRSLPWLHEILHIRKSFSQHWGQGFRESKYP